MEEQYTKVRETLKKYNQEHLLLYYEKMTDKQKETLLKEIEEINFEQLNDLFSNIKKEIKNRQETITPIDYIDKQKIPQEELVKINQKGAESIKKGELAVITMAGGQGTRLRA